MISKENQNLINTWKKLQESEEFKLLTNKLDEIIKEQDLIINTLGADFRRAYTDRDIAIVKKDNALEIKDLPQRMIDSLSGTGTQPVDNPDAYEDPNEKQEDLDDMDQEFEDDL